LAKGPSPARELTDELAEGANNGLNRLEIQGKNILKILSVGVERWFRFRNSRTWS
jgi:hypothetical protein